MRWTSRTRTASDDPRRLRELLERSWELAQAHTLSFVVVGIAGREGDLELSELIDFIESSLRVEDAIFRMTRERSVLFLADVDRLQAERVVDRLLEGFRQRFPAASPPDVKIGYFEVKPGARGVSVRDVLAAVFAPATTYTH
jgi:hypothetical protein